MQKNKIEKHDIFTIVKQENKVIITIGNVGVAEAKTFTEAKKMIDNKDYNILLGVIIAVNNIIKGREVKHDNN